MSRPFAFVVLAMPLLLVAAVVADRPSAARILTGSGSAAPFLDPGRSRALRPDGSLLVYAPSGIASAQNPAFSPNGKHILLTLFHGGYNDGGAGIWMMPFRGGWPHRLLDERGQQSVNLPGSSWSAATDRIAFASDRRKRDEIWTADARGDWLVQVTRHRSRDHYIEPSFSPDGQWIVFEARPPGPDERTRGSIWKIRSDGSQLTQLASGPAQDADNRQPNWSPTGDMIVFQRRRPGTDNWDLYTIRPDGTESKRVTRGRAGDTDASFSPDGHWLVYSSNRGGLPRANVFIVSVTGRTPLRLTRDRRHYSGAPSWSPDGRWIAYESSRGAGGESPTAIWRIRAPAWLGVAGASPIPPLQLQPVLGNRQPGRSG